MQGAPGRCGICSSDRAPIINALLAANRSGAWIETEMRRLDKPTKGETIRKHLRRCLNNDASSNAGLLQDAAAGKKVSSNADFAEAVRAEANRLLAAGKLQIRTEHGLSAQALLDRRAEKRADRQLMVEMARLLSGGAAGVLSAPDEVIVGEWRSVEDQADEADTGQHPLALVSGE